jgi:hypothetical protein
MDSPRGDDSLKDRLMDAHERIEAAAKALYPRLRSIGFVSRDEDVNDLSFYYMVGERVWTTPPTGSEWRSKAEGDAEIAARLLQVDSAVRKLHAQLLYKHPVEQVREEGDDGSGEEEEKDSNHDAVQSEHRDPTVE